MLSFVSNFLKADISSLLLYFYILGPVCMEKSCWSRDPRGTSSPPPPPPSQPERAYFSCNCLYHRWPRLTADLAEGEGDTGRRGEASQLFLIHIFWSEIGTGFWGPCGTPPPKILGSTPLQLISRFTFFPYGRAISGRGVARANVSPHKQGLSIWSGEHPISGVDRGSLRTRWRAVPCSVPGAGACFAAHGNRSLLEGKS